MALPTFMQLRVPAIALILFCAARCVSADSVIFVAPDGSAKNTGSVSSPIDLASALKPGRILPGTTLLLRGGTYTGPFRSDLAGTASSPITMRSAPGENAVITSDVAHGDGGTLNVFGQWTVYRDFEVTNSNRDRDYSATFRPMGLNIEGPHTKFINLVVHDAGHGFGFWKEAVDSELYGNIIFNGGTRNTPVDMRQGHAVYMQNTDGEKSVRDNVMFDEFGWGIHAYPGPGGVTGLHIEGNVSFNNGLSSHPRQHYNNVLVSGHTPFKTDRVEIVNNYTYYPPQENTTGRFTDANLCLGCSDAETNGEATVTGNYLVNGSPVVLANGWERLNISNNVIFGSFLWLSVTEPSSTPNAAYHIEGNHYFFKGAGGRFALNGKAMSPASWRSTTGWDTQSSFAETQPSGVQVFVRPNQYEAGRANIVVYNWDRAPAVPVDIASAINVGVRYKIYNVQNLTGTPVAEGTFDGKSVSLPMIPPRITLPAGMETKLAAEALATGPEFAVFLLLPIEQKKSLPAVQSVTRALPSEVQTSPQFTPLVGTYASRDSRAKAEVTANATGLFIRILTEPGEPQYPLIQQNGSRFHLGGTPEQFFVDFSVAGNQVRGITVIRPPLPSVFLARQ